MSPHTNKEKNHMETPIITCSVLYHRTELIYNSFPVLPSSLWSLTPGTYCIFQFWQSRLTFLMLVSMLLSTGWIYIIVNNYRKTTTILSLLNQKKKKNLEWLAGLFFFLKIANTATVRLSSSISSCWTFQSGLPVLCSLTPKHIHTDTNTVF